MAEAPPKEVATTTQRLLWALLVATAGDIGAWRAWSVANQEPEPPRGR